MRKKKHPLLAKLDTRCKIDGSYISAIDEIKKAAEEIWDLPTIGRFTDHSIKHSERIIDFALEMASGLDKCLSKDEIFFLISGCLLHDIGMQYQNYSEKNENSGESYLDWSVIRLNHAEYSVKITKALFGDKKELTNLKGTYATLSNIRKFLDKKKIHISGALRNIRIIILSHTKDSNRSESGWYEACARADKDDLRISLLSALLRFADEIDLGRHRIIDYSMFERDSIPIESIEHWLAAAIVYKVKLKRHRSLVSINIELDYTLIPADSELADFCFYLFFRQYKKIIRSLTKSIVPSEPSIADIFSKNGMSIRIEPLNINFKGELEKDSESHSNLYSAIEKTYHQMVKFGFVSDAINIQFYDYPESIKSKLCLIDEANGLRLPIAFRKRIVNWVKTEVGSKVARYVFHTAFHRVGTKENVIEEYLPDKDIVPHSVLGVAAATKSFSCDIPAIRIQPSNINCKTFLKNEHVYIEFPDFNRADNLSGVTVGSYGPWDIIRVEYVPPGEESSGEYVSVIYALITSLGETTFLTIPSDQMVTYTSDNGKNYMPGAGIENFFINLEPSYKNKKKWKNEREKLLKNITSKVKKDYKLSGRIVSSIIGYLDDYRRYKVIAWRDKNGKIPDYLHIGAVASSLFLLYDDKDEYFKTEPFNIREEIFPKKDTIEIELWGGKQNSTFKIEKNLSSINAIVEVSKSSELKLHKII